MVGRPKHKPTDEARRTVERASAYGIGQHTICKLIGVSIHTLRTYYKEELETGRESAIYEVAETLLEKALNPEITGPSVTAAIFFLKSRALWRENSPVVDDSLKEDRVDKIEWEVVDAPREIKVVK